MRLHISKLLECPDLWKDFLLSMKNGGVAIIPTDTLYGFAVDANSPEAVARIYRMKKRSERKPLILFLSAQTKMGDLGITTNPNQEKILSKFWPGPLTAIFPTPSCEVLGGFSHPTIGLRVPAHSKLIELLSRYPGMLLTTSANRSGLPSDRNPENLLEDFCPEIDWLIEDGIMAGEIPSTVVDMTSEPFKILRIGAADLKV